MEVLQVVEQFFLPNYAESEVLPTQSVNSLICIIFGKNWLLTYDDLDKS